MEITSRYNGVIKAIHFNAGDMAPTGSALLDIEVEGDVEDVVTTEAAPKAEAAEAVEEAPASASIASSDASPARVEPNGQVFATPAVRRIARENNVDLATVPGSGKDGRVTKDDILAFVSGELAPRAGSSAPAAAAAAAPAAGGAAPAPAAAPMERLPLPTFGIPEDDVRPLKGLQRTMAKVMNGTSYPPPCRRRHTPAGHVHTHKHTCARLSARATRLDSHTNTPFSFAAAWAVPHFGYCDEVSMDNLMALRKQLKPLAEARGIKLSYMPFIIKAASLALKQYPDLNAGVSPDGTEWTVKGSHNIGVAIDSPRGLIVPNIKGCQERSLFDIAYELNRLIDLAQAGKLGNEDLSGGTFTFSNIGAIGGTYASPVLNLPSVTIAALGKTQRLPRFVGESDDITAAHIMNVSWAADHRVVDGATMARFSNAWRGYLQDPITMVTDMR